VVYDWCPTEEPANEDEDWVSPFTVNDATHLYRNFEAVSDFAECGDCPLVGGRPLPSRYTPLVGEKSSDPSLGSINDLLD